MSDTATKHGVWTEFRIMREAKGFRPVDVARATNLSKGYISRLESGHYRPSPKVLALLADALNVPVAMIERRIATNGNGQAH